MIFLLFLASASLKKCSLLAEKHMTLVDNMKSLKQMLVGIGTEISTDITKGGLDFLDLVQAQAIIKYITNRCLK